MALYLIGDVQGCDRPLQTLLDTIDFSPSRDTIFLLGDLVNRGPASVAVLQRLMRYGNAARCLLGNHDIHLLAVANGVRKAGRNDTLDGILQSSARATLLDWLRHQHLAWRETVSGQPLLMVHAGVLPSWTVEKTLALAHELETALRSPNYVEYLPHLFGSTPTGWDDALQGPDRLRVIVHALTRLRFCTPDGQMEFSASGPANTAPPGYLPWFDVPGRLSAEATVAFGHWSTLGWLGRADALALDSGCVWGGCLSALRVSAGALPGTLTQELIQVPCPQAQAPDIKTP